jgi:hypothetical protein
MALDEPGDTDAVFERDGFTYVIEKSLLEKVQPVRVDFKATGFHISGQMAGLGRPRCC